MFSGYLLIHGKCVCTACYYMWKQYMEQLDNYTFNTMMIGHDALDAPLGNAAAQADLNARLLDQPARDESMRQMGEDLVHACHGAISYVKP